MKNCFGDGPLRTVFGWTLLLLAVYGLQPGARLYSQPGPFFQQAGRELKVDLFLWAPRTHMRMLREGKTAFGEKRYADGIAALGTLLMDENVESGQPAGGRAGHGDQGQDYFIESDQSDTYSSSVKEEALRLLGELPEEGRKMLEIRYGVTARQKLQEAIAARDLDAIGAVSRRYFHTQAGYDATFLLGQDRLVRGFPMAAASMFQRLVEAPAARTRYRGSLIGAAAMSWMQAQRKEAAVQVLELGAKEMPNVKTKLGDREIELVAGSDWRRILDSSNRSSLRSDQRLLDAWITTGGSPDRNASTRVGMPLPIVRWAESIHRGSQDEEAIAATELRERMQGKVLLPRLEARLLSDMLLVKTTDGGLMSIDFESGRLLWPIDFHGHAISTARRGSAFELSDGGTTVSAELQERIWGQSSYGQFSCDTENFYFIGSIGQRPFNSRRAISSGLRMPSGDSSNFLEGVSIAAEGAVQWRIGGPSGEDEPALANAYFLGPPLPYEGLLYTLVEINGETQLVVLDSKRGKKVWSQQLVHLPDQTIDHDSSRQSQSLSPSIGDGIVVCPTGHGAVVAVDLASRNLLWANHYLTRPNVGINHQFGIGMPSHDPFDPLQEKWQEPMVIIHQGVVVLTPPEYDALVCIDALTGKLLWKEKRGTSRYIAGVYGDRIIAVGQQGVIALNLLDKRPAWSQEIVLPSGEFVAGKSVRENRFLFVPTSAKRVIKIDLELGSIVDSSPVDRPLGNLFAYKNDLVSVSSTEVTVYYTRDALAESARNLLAANPRDVRGLNQKAQLELADNRVDAAVKFLEQSLKIDPQNEETKYLLVRSLLIGLDQNFERYVPLASQLDGTLEFGPQRFNFLVLLARGNIRSGNFRQAMERLLQLVQSRQRIIAPDMQKRLDLVSVDEKHQANADAWVAAELLRTMQQADPKDRLAMQQMVVQQLSKPQNQVQPARRELLRFFCWLPEAHSGLLASARNLLGGVEQTTAERLLQPVVHGGDENMRTLALAMLKKDAKKDRERLRQAHELDVTESLDPSLAAERSEDATWPRGAVRSEITQGNMAPIADMSIPQVRNRYGRPSFEIAMSGELLHVFNELGELVGRLDFERPSANGVDNFVRCQVDGGIILLETHTELMAFDLYRGLELPQDAMLWRHSLSIVPAGPNRQYQDAESFPEHSPLGFTLHRRNANNIPQYIVGPITPAGVVLKKGSEVSVLDLLTGELVWKRTGFSDRSSLASEGLEVAVIDRAARSSYVFDCRDGAAIRTVPYQGEWKEWRCSGPLLIEYSQRNSTSKDTGILDEESYASVLRVYNALTGKVAVEREFPLQSRASVCDDRYIVAIEPKGVLWYFDALTGKSAEHAIDPLAEVTNIHLQRFQNRLVLLTNSGGPAAAAISNRYRLEQLPLLGIHAVNGPFFALSAETGELLWQRPGKLSQFRFSTDQPRGSPFISFFRVSLEPKNRAALGSLAVVDLRDGSLAFASHSIASGQNQSSEVELDPIESSLKVSLGSSVVKLTFTDEPKPPQPVCNFGFGPLSRSSSESSNRGSNAIQRPVPLRRP